MGRLGGGGSAKCGATSCGRFLASAVDDDGAAMLVARKQMCSCVRSTEYSGQEGWMVGGSDGDQRPPGHLRPAGARLGTAATLPLRACLFRRSDLPPAILARRHQHLSVDAACISASSSTSSFSSSSRSSSILHHRSIQSEALVINSRLHSDLSSRLAPPTACKAEKPRFAPLNPANSPSP